jgi:hypothetical protein
MTAPRRRQGAADPRHPQDHVHEATPAEQHKVQLLVVSLLPKDEAIVVLEHLGLLYRVLDY